MAHKQSNSLIHCSACGEDYSATYKFCPFCGGRNAPTTSKSKSNPKSNSYEFDGQDVFDQSEEEAGGKGGKRLAGSAPQHPAPPPPVNWPRLITFLCSLVIIAATLIMAFTVVYPHLRPSDPTAAASPSPSQTVSQTPEGVASDDGLKGMTLDTVDLTLQADQSHPLTLVFDPVEWTGTVTWTSSDETCATVNQEGVVTNVNTSGSQRRVIITATTGSHTVTCTVYCQSGTSVEPTTAPTPEPTTTPTTAPTPAPNPGGDIPAGSKATIANASGGLRVRSGPGTNNSVVASLKNGDPITVVSYAQDGWYQIQYAGSNGAETGYVMAEYIQVN